MLFSTTSEMTSGIGSVATSVFDDIGLYAIIIIGIILGFFIIEKLAVAIFPKHYGEPKQNDV